MKFASGSVITYDREELKVLDRRQHLYEGAKRQRARKLARETELLTACECEYPVHIFRNGHGHGTTVDGHPCPAIAIHERLEEREREDDL